MTTEIRKACASLTSKLTNVQIWDSPITQYPNVQSCVTHHHHPVPQAKIAPKLHVSSGGVEHSEMRESVTKKPRVDTAMEINAIETLTNAKLEVDRALDRANKTLHRLLEEIPLESEAVTTAAELNSIRDKRVHTEVYENEADAKIISGKWVLKPQGTIRAERLRGRSLRQRDDDSISEDATLASNGPQEQRFHSVHSRRESRPSQRTHEGR